MWEKGILKYGTQGKECLGVLGKLLKLHIEKKMEGGGVTGKGGNNTELQKLKE